VSVQRVIVIAGASGTGKTTIAAASGIPVLSLDAFYRPATETELPRWFGDVDWEHPATFDLEAAAAATRALIRSGRTQFRSHDLVTEVSQKDERVVVAPGPCLVVEGVMATEVVATTNEATGYLLSRRGPSAVVPRCHHGNREGSTILLPPRRTP
jgi:uridine kinase